jgi:hypothetical protein
MRRRWSCLVASLKAAGWPAVVKSLVGKHGIDEARLIPFGAGPLVSAASSSEESILPREEINIAILEIIKVIIEQLPKR